MAANSDRLRRQCYQIRHAVYCEEFGFETSDVNANEEFDAFDAYSKHFLIQCRLSQKFIGTFRVVHRAREQHLPIEYFYNASHWSEGLNPALFSDVGVVEVSRLAVLNPQRCRFDFRRYEVARLLYLSAATYFYDVDSSRYMYCFMEQRLAHKLIRIGLPFVQCGKPVEFRGQRAPFLLTKDNGGVGLSAGDQRLCSILLERLKNYAFNHDKLI